MQKALDKIDKLDHKTIAVMVFFLYIASCIIRSVFACFSKSLMIYPDEIRYIDISRSIFNGTGILVHNVHMNFDQILYPLLIAPFNLIKDQILKINAISVFNAVLMSSVLFPVFLIGKKILKRNSIVLLLVLTVFLLPDLSMTATFMSENLFYPLAAWLIYFAFRFWDSDNNREKIMYCVLCAAFCFFAYLTKVVAVYFVAGFVFSLGFDSLFTKKHTLKQNIKYAVLFCAVALGAVLAFKLLILLLLGSGHETYSGNRRLSVYDLNTLVYFLYAAVFNITFALTAFFYFPVILPALNFKRLSKSEKNILVFALVSLLTMIVIITCSISLNEDYPKLFMRQHTRYYSPLLIIFLALFYKLCFSKSETAETTAEPLPVWLTAAPPVLFCIAVVSVLRFVKNVCIDGVLLQTFCTLGEPLSKVAGDPNEFHVRWQLVLVKFFLILTVVAFTVILFNGKTKRAGARVFVALIFTLSVFNNFYAVKEFRRVYKQNPGFVKQAIAVNDYVSKVKGNVLVISDGYDPALDTFITVPVYWTKKEEIKKLIDGKRFVDLAEDEIVSNYPSIPYENLGTVDYIITDNTVRLEDKSNNEIKIDGVYAFKVYKNTDNKKIYIEK
ncbi:MAG: glycosyltransferase family 39 protein [Bacillota bacterium]|nr:glycosyltransferase family 39 protein [Bacillota bacterium]